MMAPPRAGEAVPESLAAEIRRSRWFPAKGTTHGDVGPLRFEDVVPLTAGAAAGEASDRAYWLAIIAAGESPPIRLVVPLAGADPVDHAADSLDDTAADSRLIARLLALVANEGCVEAGRGRLEGHRARPLGRPAGGSILPEAPGPVDVTRLGGDASNTSLLVTAGPQRMSVKVIRRCQGGLHPQVEIGRFFAEHSPFAGTPALLGWLDYTPHGGPAATVLIVEAFLEGRETGWDRMLARVGHDWEGCLADARSLGRVTASMHAALAAREDVEAFAPRGFTEDAAARVAAGLVAHATRALDRIAALARSPETPLGPRLAAIAGSRDAILGRLAAVAASLPSVTQIRVHGDYHLGQVLVSRDAHPSRMDAWSVIDFEGEPARPLAERRGRHPAAKDVAGMCRSFDYLLRVASAEGRRPYDPLDLAALESAFLDAYRDNARGRNWWPDDGDEEHRLLAAWKLDKALYELLYECDNRPDWIEVPLAAVETLASRLET